jgi:LysM repeat protein
MLKRFQPRLALTALVCVGLLLGACTRSASQNNLPTATITGGDPLGVGGGDQDATMAAIGTLITGQATQTAVAAAGGGEVPLATATVDPAIGGAVATPIPTVGGLPLPTATLDPGVISPPTAAPPVAGVPCPNPYTVQTGDWIYQIARKCGLAARDIIAANPGIDANNIVPGQVINLPTGTTTTPATAPAPAAGCTGTRTVVTGDTLFRIAYNCGLTAEQLAATNGIAFPYTIFPGQVIRFP